MYVDTEQPSRLTRRYLRSAHEENKMKKKNTTYLGILQMMSVLSKVHIYIRYVHAIGQVGQEGR